MGFKIVRESASNGNEGGRQVAPIRWRGRRSSGRVIAFDNSVSGTQRVVLLTTSDTFVENERSDSLDLNVQNAFEAPDHARPQVASATPSARPNPLDVSKFQKQAPEVESYNLFKSEYGLRGFMKQNWINQRVALLGGLGLNDDRLIETEDDDLRDDIAFGMGLIVAF